ncbi:hypothetical protein FKM82_000510 [Ascaphus truei]
MPATKIKAIHSPGRESSLWSVTEWNCVTSLSRHSTWLLLSPSKVSFLVSRFINICNTFWKVSLMSWTNRLRSCCE